MSQSPGRNNIDGVEHAVRLINPFAFGTAQSQTATYPLT